MNAMVNDISQLLNKLKQANRDKLYNLLLWLNEQDEEASLLADDKETRDLIKESLKTVVCADDFIKLIVSYDICALDEWSQIPGTTYRDIATGLAMNYLC